MVTGSARGIGFEIARGLGRSGASLIIHGRNRNRLDSALNKLRGEGLDVHGCTFNITSKGEVEANIADIEQNEGQIDILVNNAGMIARNSLLELGEKEWDETLRVNLTGVFLISQCVARNMIRRQSGKIININSLMSELGRPNVGAYAASKGGLKMLTKNMAAEWGPYNIQANGIGPGYIRTELTIPLQENREFDSYLMKRTPAKRWGIPSDMIGPAIFLASSASDFVNGHVLYVDGGILASF